MPYYYKDNVLKIERYAVIDIANCEEDEYDVFDLELNDGIKRKVRHYSDNAEYSCVQLDDAQFLSLFQGNKNNNKYRHKKIYLYSRVISEKIYDVIISITCLSRAKFWLNNKCLTIHNEQFFDPSFCVSAELRSGINDIVIELCPDKEWGPLTLEIDKTSEAVNSSESIDPIIYIHNTSHYSPELDTFSLMCMTNNRYYKKEFRMKILISDKSVKSIRASFNKRIDIDISQLRMLCPNKLSSVNIICCIKTIDGEMRTLSIPRIIVADFSDEADKVADDLKEAVRYIDNEVVYHHITGSIREQESEKAGGIMLNYFDLATENKKLLWQLRNGSLSNDFYLNENASKVYMYSDLDDSYIKLTVKMPVRYEKCKIYPALISINLAHRGDFSRTLGMDKLTEPCFSFDVTGRGVTGGSYIGEASILEIVRWIIKHYNIDEHRLYFLGKSNGGFATYSIAQNYPDLPAAIFPLGGYPNVSTLKNISNIPTYQIVSRNDFVNRGRPNEVKQIINEYGNYHQHVNHNYYHSDVIKHIGDSEFINAMLRKRRNDYPHRVIFKTYRNRHLRSFWIKLHGISTACKCASIDASIESDTKIRVKLRGADGVTITLPPQIMRIAFDIIINNQTLHFNNYTDDAVILSRKGGWHIAENEPEVDLVKGNGLLDVYMDALRIIIPDGAPDDIINSAAAFSQPSSNGFVQHIHVKYPVFKESETPKRQNKNLIIFDSNNVSESARAFADFLMIKYDETGFEFNGTRCNNDYVIMQVITNPYNIGKSVLVISTNNVGLLWKCLFTRKVVIPFYSNGLHQYLNNACLVYTGGKYYGIYERGADMKVID